MCWQELCIAKQFGGMGILDLPQMNSALLLKWWWRYKDPHYSNLWKFVLIANLNSHIPPSPFWKDIQALSHFGQLGVTYQPGAQGSVDFWHDTWYQQCPLKVTFPQLFDICFDTHVTIQDVVTSQGGCLHFRRTLTGVLSHEWHQVLEIISSTSFTHDLDQLAWVWDAQGKYTLHSMYLFFNFHGEQPLKPL